MLLDVAQVPHWALMPIELQLHGIRYTLVGAATGYGTLFLYKCVLATLALHAMVVAPSSSCGIVR